MLKRRRTWQRQQKSRSGSTRTPMPCSILGGAVNETILMTIHSKDFSLVRMSHKLFIEMFYKAPSAPCGRTTIHTLPLKESPACRSASYKGAASHPFHPVPVANPTHAA